MALLEFKPTQPLNENFRLMGISNMNFLLNSGSYFVFLSGILLNFAVLKCLNKLCTMSPRSARVRQVALLINSQMFNLGGAVLKLVMETYIDMVLSTFLMVYAF